MTPVPLVHVQKFQKHSFKESILWVVTCKLLLFIPILGLVTSLQAARWYSVLCTILTTSTHHETLYRLFLFCNSNTVFLVEPTATLVASISKQISWMFFPMQLTWPPCSYTFTQKHRASLRGRWSMQLQRPAYLEGPHVGFLLLSLY